MFLVIAGIFFLLALGALLRDALVSVGEGVWTPVVLGQWWSEIHRDSLLLLQPAVERHLDPVLWDPYILGILETPAAVCMGAIGAFFWVLHMLFGRRSGRRRRA